MKMTIYAYFKKIYKIKISNAVFKTTKGTEVYTCWQEFHTLTTLSAKKKHVASTVVTMRFKQFVSMSSGLANMTKVCVFACCLFIY